MPRAIEVSLPPGRAEGLIQRLNQMDGVVGLALQRDASIQPPGDILTIHATNDGTRAVMNLLADDHTLDGGTILTSEPRSLINPQYQNGINGESNETIWDEMAFLLRRETNLSANYLLLMTASGGVAAVGLWTNTLHLVIAAMVIAPGFEPLLRIPFGWIAGPRALASRGLLSSLIGYLLLGLGAALTYLLLRAIDASSAGEFSRHSWVQYWSTLTANGALVSLMAGGAGALVVAAQRSVLAAGVMIALALVPSMSIAGIALFAGDFSLAGRGILRWAYDVVAVVFSSAVVLGLKQALVHRRKALS